MGFGEQDMRADLQNEGLRSGSILQMSGEIRGLDQRRLRDACGRFVLGRGEPGRREDGENEPARTQSVHGIVFHGEGFRFEPAI
jgi:hypothetical protein